MTNLYPPHVVGGFELQCAFATERWRARGWRVSVLTRREPPVADPDPDVLRRLPPPPRWGGWRRLPATLHGIWDARSAAITAGAIRRTRPDVVVVWGTWGLSRGVLAQARALGIPMVHMVYDHCLLDHLIAERDQVYRGPLGALLGRLHGAVHINEANLRADRWIFCSRLMRSLYEAVTGPVPGGTVIHHGVDVPATRPALPAPATRLRVGAAGRLTPQKGFHTLAAAARLLAEADPGGAPEVEIRGPVMEDDHEYRGYHAILQGEVTAARTAGARIEVGPAMSYADYLAWLRTKDCIVVPAEWEEPFALVPLEAMAAGRAVVGNARGGAAEVLDEGVNALVYPSGDAPALADRLRALASDRPLLERIAAEGYETVRRRHRVEGVDQAIDAVVEAAVGSRATLREVVVSDAR